MGYMIIYKLQIGLPILQFLDSIRKLIRSHLLLLIFMNGDRKVFLPIQNRF